MGLVSTLAINGVIFRIWGMNFFQVANASDILLAGANVLSITFLATIGIILLSLPFTLLFWSQQKIHSRSWRKNAEPKLESEVRPYILLLFSTVLGVSLFLVGHRLNWFWPHGKNHDTEWWTPYIAVFLVLESVFLAVVLTIFRSKFSSEALAKIKIFIHSPVFLFSLSIILILANSSIYAVLAKPDWRILNADYDCEQTLVVLWIGSETVAAHCGNIDDRIYETEQVILLPRNDLRFEQLEK